MARGKDTAFQNVSSMIDYPSKKRWFSFKRQARAGCTSQAIFQAPHLVLGILPKAILEHNRTSLLLVPPARGSASPSRSLEHLPTRRGGFTLSPGLWQATHHSSAPRLGVSCSCRQRGAADTSSWTHHSLQPYWGPSHHSEQKSGQ